MTRQERNKAKEKKIQGEKRNRFLKIIFILLTSIVLFVVGLFLYARYIGTSGLFIREYPLKSDRIPDSFNGFKIIHFSDLHYGTTVNLKELKHLVEEINLRSPDLVVFTGDLIDRKVKLDSNEIDQIIEELKKINSTVGKYAVSGNHDYINNYFQDIMTKSEFHLLNNNHDLIYLKERQPILITGIPSSLQDDINIDQAFEHQQVEKEIFTILLLHEPDNIDKVLSNYQVDLAFAGHSHNGQIRLPWTGPIITIQGGKTYNDEFYQINNTKLYISGGIGTSNYPLRLFTRPSFNFYRIMK